MDTKRRIDRFDFRDLTCRRSVIGGRSCLALDFVVLVLSPPRRTVLSETVLVLDGCSDCGDAVFSFGKVYL